MPAPVAAPPPAIHVVSPVTAARGRALERDRVAQTQVLIWELAEPPACDGGPAKAQRMVMPLAIPLGKDSVVPSGPVMLDFRIAPNGTPLDIAATEKDAEVLADSGFDLEPSLAGSHFEPRARVASCHVTFSPHVVSLADAPPAAQAQILAEVQGADEYEFVQSLFEPEGADCRRRLTPVEVHFPDTAKWPDLVGTIDVLAARFDIDAGGHTQGVEAVYTSLDEARKADTLAAFTASRFQPGAHRGCVRAMLFPPQKTVPAPVSPPANAFQDARATCPRNGASLLRVSQIPFPPAFQHRNIEGWGIIRFDLSPAGEVGNVTVVKAEPASGFGLAAAAVVGNASADPTPSGYRGCVTRIRFAIDDVNPEGVYGGKS